jgi:hypothetical protein
LPNHRFSEKLSSESFRLIGNLCILIDEDREDCLKLKQKLEEMITVILSGLITLNLHQSKNKSFQEAIYQAYPKVSANFSY